MRFKKEETLYVILFSCVLIVFVHLTGASVRLLARQADSSAIRRPTIVIDAGHGGEDGGTTGNGLLEKDVNLPISRTLQVLFQSEGFEVVMLRNGDVDLGDHSLQTVRERKASDLKHRAELVNAAGSCILISIHQNYFEQSQYSGTQVFFAAGNNGSEELAQCIQMGVKSLLQPDNEREIKPGENIYLLDHISVPAVIVECGFLSNAAEAEWLSQEEYRQQMALCIFGGVCEYAAQSTEENAWFEIPG